MKYSGVGSIRKYLEICLKEKGKPYIFIHSILLGCSGYRRKLPLVDGNTTKRLTERLLVSGFKIQRKRFSLHRLYQAWKEKDSMKKYSWPASAVSEKDMQILYDMRQKTQKPIPQLIKEAIRITYSRK